MKKVQDPDRAHGWQPQKVTAGALLRPGHSSDYYYWKTRLAGETVCRVCGGSKATLVHLLYEPKRRPNLAAALAAIEAANAAFDPYRMNGGSR